MLTLALCPCSTLVCVSGIGDSTFPTTERCTTQRMAYDALALVDHLGWKEFYVAGVSMGGMISEELALLAPHRILALALIVTHAGGRTARAPIAGSLGIVTSLIKKRTNDDMARGAMSILYSSKTLSDPSSDQYQRLFRHHLNRLESRKKPVLSGALGQIQAVFTHYLNYTQLLQIRYSTFPTLVLVGTEDKLVNPVNSKMLAETLGSEYVVLEDAAHGLLAEHPEKSNAILKAFFERAAQLRSDAENSDQLKEQWAAHHQALALACRHRPHCNTKLLREFVLGYLSGFLFRLIFHRYLPPAQLHDVNFRGDVIQLSRFQQSRSFGLLVASIRAIYSSLLCIYRQQRYKYAVTELVRNKSLELKNAPEVQQHGGNQVANQSDRHHWPDLAMPGLPKAQLLCTALAAIIFYRNARLLAIAH